MKLPWGSAQKISAAAGSLSFGLFVAWLIVRLVQPIWTPSPTDHPKERVPAVAAKNLFPEAKPFREATFRVVDPTDGSFVPKYTVAWLSGGESRPIRSVDGVFKLDGEFMENDFLQVNAPGYHGALVPFGSLPIQGCVLPVFREGSLAVRCVAWGSGMSIPNAVVTIEQPGMQPVSSLSSPDGLAELSGFSVQSLSAAPERQRFGVRLTVRASGRMPKLMQVVVEDNRDWRSLEVQLPQAELVDAKVVDAETGRGIAGVKSVHNWDFGGVMRVNDFEEAFESDEDGRISLSVPEGATRIEVVAYHPEYALSGTVLKDFQEVKRDSELGRVQILLPLDRGYPVKGIVLDEKDNPIAGVMVGLHLIKEEGITDWMRYVAHQFFGGMPDVAPTDREGIFTLLRVAAGDYRVIPTRSDRYPDRSNPLLTVGPGENFWVGFMQEGITIDGITETPEGTGIPGVHVSFSREEGPGVLAKGFSRDVTTGADGGFQVKALAPGPYSVTFVASKVFTPVRVEVNPSEPHPSPWRFILPTAPMVGARGPAGFEKGGR